MRKALCLLSGGLDSTVLAHLLVAEGYEVHALSFDYGQRHRKELDFARRTAARLGIRHSVLDFSTVGSLLKGSSLTDAIPVPEGHHESPEMALTVVTNRNAILLSVAFGVAASEGASMVAVAAHAGDRAIYPDCRREFLAAFEETEALALGRSIRLFAPFLDMAKAGIIRLGRRLACRSTKPGPATRVRPSRAVGVGPARSGRKGLPWQV
jgi:7-cyano-7-deazaguanine synthase